MSKYTTTIKSLIDNNFDFQLTDYPIFDEEYRETLNKNILDYYYISEIGFETPALFRHFSKPQPTTYCLFRRLSGRALSKHPPSFVGLLFILATREISNVFPSHETDILPLFPQVLPL